MNQDSSTKTRDLVTDLVRFDHAKHPDIIHQIFGDNGPDWESNTIDERQAQEIAFAKIYAQDFNHGTAGHNRLALIARLADVLDVYEAIVSRFMGYIDEGRLDL